MESRKKGQHGGKRVGAGRKAHGRKHDAPHRQRPELSSEHPVHVVMRVPRRYLRLRTGETYGSVRRVLPRYLGREDFRVVHVSIQHNHLHFIVEASDRRALTHGMQSLAINLARRINRDLRRRGKVFEFRYHATQIRTTWHARNALAYVLNNWRRHREDFHNGRLRAAALDPYSSGLAFRGWTRGQRFAIPRGYGPLDVSAPTTWLLRIGWLRHGYIDPHELPGPLW